MSSKEWSGPGWTVTITDSTLTVAQGSGTAVIPSTECGLISLRHRWFRRYLDNGDQPILRLTGLSKSDAGKLKRALSVLQLAPAIKAATEWYERTTDLLSQAANEQRWVSSETVEGMLASRPPQGVLGSVRAAGIEAVLTSSQRAALVLLDDDLEQTVAAANEKIMAAELAARRRFFDTIEKTPLTEEQARAVICFDNRVQLLAAAGSGKTSVMVARAAYAVARRFVRPEKIVLLAFNKAAAEELQERVETRFAAAGIDSSGVRASTFHSFGLDVIGRATGRKPRLAPWLERSDGIEMIEQIVDELRDRDEQFRYHWDLYRILYARAPISLDVHEPDGWDSDSKENGYRTFAGPIVRSHGERLVADFLYLNGVDFEYERTYPHVQGDATHGRYRPDFYYPDIDVWHEHWALDRDGQPPATFAGYAEGMAWKRSVHRRHGTSLIETTFAGVLWGDDLTELARELTRRGLTLDWNPDRPPRDQWVKPVKHQDMYRLMRTFMSHVKSNSSTRQRLDGRLDGDLKHLAGARTALFLDLYWAVAAEWEARLTAEGAVDFEDMLVAAADHLEAGQADLGYQVVLVDEFQDASQARARLVRALVAKPGRYLLAVGDDWQSINRFAGADLSVMTDFTTWFGPGPQLALTTTFRCPQTICDTAASFISQNPRQFTKQMRSAHTATGVPVDVIRSRDPRQALYAYLRQLSDAVTDGTIPRGPDGTVTVDVLGRYRHEAGVMPRLPPHNLDVTFRTVHSAKGLEADYVVVPGMITGTYGFPSTITDDPVLHLAMPAPETYQHAEERRLLYVALTRARRAVTLITDPHRMSPFVVELIDAKSVTIDGQPLATKGPPNSAARPSNDPDEIAVCPWCSQGALVNRSGRFGLFLGCSRFPACQYTRSLSPRSP